MSEHTPGPWVADPNSGYVFAEDGQMMVCQIRGWGRLTGTGGGRGLPDSEAFAIQTANNHLIAAAPDLLAALTEMVATYGDFDTGKPFAFPEDHEINRARAAIARATQKGPSTESTPHLEGEP